MNRIDYKNIYSHLIAGRLPVGSGDVQRVVFNQAYAILGTNKLHIYYQEIAGFVYYFAVESRWLSSTQSFYLPFTDILPGGRLHVGDAVYQVSGPDFMCAVVLERSSMRLLCNNIEVLKDYLAGLDLRVIEISINGGAPLKSASQIIQGVSERFNSWVMKISIGILATSSMTFLGAHLGQMYLAKKIESTPSVSSIEADLNKTLSDLSIQQPLARQLARVQKVSATVVRSGGWIESYKLEGEKDETFELMLPSWVSQDYIDALGRDVVTDLRDIDGLLVVRKTVKKGKKP